jgi:hypothetical protein
VILAVLNPAGNDRARLFYSGAGSPTDPGHPPVNYHAYAACLRTGFFQKEKEIPPHASAALVLLRKNGLKDALYAVEALKRRNCRTFISWKESGLHQVAASLEDRGRYERFRAICQAADGFISSTQELASLYQTAGCPSGEFIPTPYPVEEPVWNFSRPLEQRRGILIGTREFDVPSRNHLLAISLALKLGEPVTVINTDGYSGERQLRAISADMRIINGRQPYPDYLRLMANHRLVFQMDRSAVPGQVAGDALLCRIPCVGGDSAIERLAFSSLSGFGRDAAEILAIARNLLVDEAAYQAAIEASQQAALESVSFSAVAKRLWAIMN